MEAESTMSGEEGKVKDLCVRGNKQNSHKPASLLGKGK